MNVSVFKSGKDVILIKFLEDQEKWTQFESFRIIQTRRYASARNLLAVGRARNVSPDPAALTSAAGSLQSASPRSTYRPVDLTDRPVPPRPADDPLGSPTVPTTVKTSDLKSLSELKSEHEAEINETKKQNDKKVLVLSLGLGVGLTAAFAGVVVVLVKMNYVVLTFRAATHSTRV